MKLTPTDLNDLANTALKAASNAANIISAKSSNTITVHKKSGKDSLAAEVVTEVDLQSQECILETLQPTIARYDLGLLTEETTDDNSRFEKDYFWCIDPLDGTLPFIESTSGYAVSIALVKNNGVPVIGVIHDPRKGTVYHAIQGNGAYKNNLPFTIPQADTFTFVCDRSLLTKPEWEKLSPVIKNIASHFGNNEFKTISHGGAAMNAMWVLENAPACYIKPIQETGGGCLWDYAASTCIYNELHLPVCDYGENAPELNRKDSTNMNHKGLLYASSKEIKDFLIRNIASL